MRVEIKKRTVKTFDEFSSCIKEFEQNSNRCNHSFDMMAFYRGHSNEEYVCQPTVFRNILGREDNMLKREDEIVKLCRRGFSCEFSHLKSDFDMLAKLGLIDALFHYMPENEVATMQTILNMVLDDLMENERSLVSMMEGASEGVVDMLAAFSNATKELIEDAGNGE